MLLSGAGANAATEPVAAADEFREAVMSVTVNAQQDSEMLVVLRDSSDTPWLDAADFARFRLLTPPGPGRQYQGRTYLPLLAIPGSRVDVVESTQSIAVTAPPAAFMPTRLDAPQRPPPALTRASPGAFLNYQLSAQRVAGEDLAGVYAELGVFAARGVLTNSGVVRSLAGHDDSVRLDTTFTADFPASMERLTIGDAISDGGTWASAVRFGGVGWSRNFSLRPDLVTTPLLTASGTAVVPSTVDVFVNNQRVSSSTLPPGPFVIDRFPAVNGAGQVTVVVRDALGREQLLTQPFYSSPRLLAAGLSQFEVDLGKIREDYSYSSSQYGPTMGSASYRRGMSNSLTVEAHGEFLDREAHAAGLASAIAVGRIAVLNLTAATGGTPSTSGSLYGVGLERQGQRFSFGFVHAEATSGYRQISSAEQPSLQFRERDLAQVGVNLQRWGTLAAVMVRQKLQDLPTERTASLSYSRNLLDRGSLNLTATRSSQGGAVGHSVYLTFTLALSARRTLVLAANTGNGLGAPDDEAFATYSQTPPLGPGQGYRLGGSSSGNYEAELDQNWQAGELQLQAARNQGVSGVSGFWSGAATLLGGDVHAARQVPESLALVDVAGLPNVPVYLDNQLITHTDSQGRALLSDLLPYQANRVNIEPTELPLDTSIGARTLVVTPGYRSGVIVRFPVERVHGGTFKLVTAAGIAVPAGALVQFMGNSFPVTYDGMTYVTGLERAAEGTAQWGDTRCGFQLPPPPPGDPLPDMGTVTCHPVVTEGRTP